MSENTVRSPLGLRLLIGLMAPLLSPKGQEEVTARWGETPQALQEEALATVALLKGLPSVTVALGLWTRESLPAGLEEEVLALVKTLPEDNREAQEVLDRWAQEETFDLIKSFPLQVTSAHRLVLGSAVALDLAWRAQEYTSSLLLFGGKRAPAFMVTGDTFGERWGTGAQGSFLLEVPTEAEAITMVFALPQGGVQEALEDLRGEGLWGEIPQEHPSRQEALSSLPHQQAVLPSFKLTYTWEIMDEVEEWGLQAAATPGEGVPGLGEGNYLLDAVQEALIEVSPTGVKAAAVTAMGVGRALALRPSQHRVSRFLFDRPFAFQVRHASLGVLFEGTVDSIEA